jgi:hypothetical protein
MAYTVIVHLAGEASIVGEIDELPKNTDTIIMINNPRLRDGKDLHYIEPNVTKVIWSFSKISFIELMESSDDEELIGFVRE